MIGRVRMKKEISYPRMKRQPSRESMNRKNNRGEKNTSDKCWVKNRDSAWVYTQNLLTMRRRGRRDTLKCERFWVEEGKPCLNHYDRKAYSPKNKQKIRSLKIRRELNVVLKGYGEKTRKSKCGEADQQLNVPGKGFRRGEVAFSKSSSFWYCIPRPPMAGESRGNMGILKWS